MGNENNNTQNFGNKNNFINFLIKVENGILLPNLNHDHERKRVAIKRGMATLRKNYQIFPD